MYVCAYYIYICMYIHIKTAGKWQKCNLVSGMPSVASDMGWLRVDRPRTSADEWDAVWALRCCYCVWAVAGFGRFHSPLVSL